jgi:superfamily I DNA and/or RNA helicase
VEICVLQGSPRVPCQGNGVGSSVNIRNSCRESKRGAQWAGALNDLCSWGTIDSVIIDEASQLWEGRALTLFSMFPGAKHFVVVGDEQQLAPHGSDKVPCKSLFDRLLSTEGVPNAMLSVTYRLPVQVAEPISAKMYESKLLAWRDAAAELSFYQQLETGLKAMMCETDVANSFLSGLLKRTSLRWADITTSPHGVGTDSFTKSLCNPSEATSVAKIAADCWEVMSKGYKFSSAGRAAAHDPSIVIITPYEEQRAMIENKLADELARLQHKEASGIKDWLRSKRVVTCIDGYQGQEADIVICSMTRTEGLGFLTEACQCYDVTV